MRSVLPEAAEASSESWSMPAPVGGWNARDALALMKPTDALQLDNWFPRTTDVTIRPGCTSEATITAGQSIKTLMGLAKADGTYMRFAASQAGIYNITAGGLGVLSSAATIGSWEHIQINVGGVSYLWCCTGDSVNKARIYNGTTDTWTLLDGASVPPITGITSTDVANVSLWKSRVILCERSSLKFWYGPLASVAGAFSAFDLGQVFKKGGYLVATANWTIDAGDGADDRFVAISSEGEVAIYQGTDPSAAATFALVGVYHIGKPIGKRCFLQLAGDLGVLTEQGLWPLSRALQSSTVDKRIALTDRIQSAFNSYYKLYGSQAGWQAALLPKGPALLVNVPLSSTVSYQFVMNLITGAWCRFTNWNAAALMVLDGELYYGLGASVYKAWVGTSDNDAAITAIAATAYTGGPAKARGKQIKMVRPIFQTGSPIRAALRLNTNYASAAQMSPELSAPTGTSLWDSAVFDSSLWSGLMSTSKSWKTVRHSPSQTYSLQLGVQIKGFSVEWMQTDFIGEVAKLSLS